MVRDEANKLMYVQLEFPNDKKTYRTTDNEDLSWFVNLMEKAVDSEYALVPSTETLRDVETIATFKKND